MRNVYRRISVPLMLTIAIASSGCVAHQTYRGGQGALGPLFGDAVGDESPIYGLIPIEFDDSGELWSHDAPAQAVNLMYEILEATESADTRPLLVLFVHGWKHDASRRNEADGNLNDFHQMLIGITKDWQRGASFQERVQRPVVGIYIGWRGDSVALPEPLKSLSYFDRNAAAERVAGSAAASTLYSLMSFFKSFPGGRVVVIGHSMGAKIVERAVTPALLTSVMDSERWRRQTQHQPAADLVLLINSASPAVEAKKIVDTLNAFQVQPPKAMWWADTYMCERGGTTWAPFVVSITSDSDNPNRYLFPIGNSLATIFRRTRSYDRWTVIYDDDIGMQRINLAPDGLAMASMDKDERALWLDGDSDALAEKGVYSLPSQRFFLTRTAGFAPALHTHRVLHDVLPIATRDNAVAPCTPEECAARPSGFAFKDETHSVPAGAVCFRAGKHRFVLQEQPMRYNTTPYWIMRVPSSVVPGHSGIFGDELYAFIRGLVAMTPVSE